MSSVPDPVPEIRLVGLTKRFRGVLAVDAVSLAIRPGEFFSLLGPSGCGKTTTLRMIGGFEAPTGGLIEFRGVDVTRDPPDKRPVNMVFQNYALFPHLDVGNNVAFGLRRRHVERAEITRRVGEALDLVHLEGYQARHPGQLSGGQQQRVALARALVNRPNVLLLDEPLGALDLKLRKRLQIELKRIQTEVGITFVYVTHDQEEALTMSDRIGVMNRGRLEQLGTPEELYERPATPFVADFIGTTNLLHGVVEGIGPEGAILRLDSGDRCRINGSGRSAGQDVDISIRPEAIQVRAGDGELAAGQGGAPAGQGGAPAEHPGAPAGQSRAPAGGKPELRAVIEQVAYLGAAVQYHARTKGDLTLTAVAPKSGFRFAPGDPVVLEWDPAEALVLGDRPAEMEVPR